MATGLTGKQIKDDTLTGDDIDESTLVLPYFINTSYTANASDQKVYVRPADVGSTNSPGVNNKFITPSGGKLKYVLIRSDSTPGNTDIGFHKASDDTPQLNTTATETQPVNIFTEDRVVKATFSNATFNAHDIIGVSVNPTNNHGRVNLTIVLELNIQ